MWNWLCRALAGETGQNLHVTPYLHSERVILAALLILALAIRITAAMWYPSVHHPDETFQYWEQGYRIAFGQGMVPWEYRTGIRSYFIPLVLAGIMKTVAAFSGGVDVWTPIIQVLLSALSLSIVATAFAWGRRAGGTSAAILAGIMTCTWFELVYFAPKPLTESISASLLFPAAYFLCVRHSSRVKPVVGGLFLGLAVVVRFQLAPAVLLIALANAVLNGPRRSLPAALAAAGIVLAGGMLDWLTLGSPFQSIWLNFVVNAVEGKASSYGVEPPHWFLLHFSEIWAGFAIVMVVLVLTGLRRAPILLFIAVVIVLAHSAIGHKEYRFVFPAVPFLLTLAAIGAGRLLDAVVGYVPHRRVAGLAMVALSLTVTSINLANQPVFREYWFSGSNALAAFSIAAKVEQTCGIGLAGWQWVDTPGYRGLGLDVPLYPLTSAENGGQMQSAFNVVVFRGERPNTLDQYERVGCSGAICIARRSGTCTPMPEQTVNPFLVRTGQ